LEDHVGIEFEEIIKDRHVFAFKNGIYFAKVLDNDECVSDTFIPYSGPGSKKIGSSIVSANYFDMDFDMETVRDPNNPSYKYNNWWNIVKDKCPNLKSIMEY
jgi:hypothetical protein